MKSFTDRNPYAIGAVSTLLIAAAVGIAFLAGVLRIFEKTYTVRAVFSDAAGIRAGDDVRVAGVKAGRVDGVKADRRAGNVVVKLEVHHGIDLGPDTRAEIALETLLGTKFVRLTGPVVQPYLADRPAAARVIPITRTKTPFDVFELTKVGTRAAQQTDTAKLNQLITDLADITQGKRDQVGQLVNGIAQVSGAIRERDTQLRELLDRADKLSGTLAEKDQTLVALIDQSRGILDLIERRQRDIAAAMRDGATSVDLLAGVLQRNKAHLDAILTTLHPTIDILQRRAGVIDRSLAWLGPGAYGLAFATSHGPWEDIYIRGFGPDVPCLYKRISDPAAPC